jgi:hypothetical protein
MNSIAGAPSVEETADAGTQRYAIIYVALSVFPHQIFSEGPTWS